MSKLGSIIRHEYLTIVKQPSFWIVMVAIPLMVSGIIALTVIGNQASSDRIEELANELKNVSLVDESGLINNQVVESSGLYLSSPEHIDVLREDVINGDKEALVVFPESLAEDRSYQIYVSSDDITLSSSVSSLADNILKTSLFLPLGSPEIIALAQSGAASEITAYKDGKETGGFNDYIAPGIFIVLFYIIFAFSVSYMLTSVSEEKENRSMEMVLTYVKPRVLIVGKLLGVSLITLTQVAFFATLGIIGFLILQNVGGSGVALPAGIDLAKLTVDFWPIFFGLAFLIVGFLLFAGFMTATAAAAPSAKEANNFSSVFFIGAFIPFYFIMPIVTDGGNQLVQILTYFPLTSPVVNLIRNAVGNMELAEQWLALGVMTMFMMFAIWIAIRAFKLGALEFSNRISFKALFRK